MTASKLNFEKGDFVRKKLNAGMAACVMDGPMDDAGDVFWKVRLPDGNGWELKIQRIVCALPPDARHLFSFLQTTRCDTKIKDV